MCFYFTLTSKIGNIFTVDFFACENRTLWRVVERGNISVEVDIDYLIIL